MGTFCCGPHSLMERLRTPLLALQEGGVLHWEVYTTEIEGSGVWNTTVYSGAAVALKIAEGDMCPHCPGRGDNWFPILVLHSGVEVDLRDVASVSVQ